MSPRNEVFVCDCDFFSRFFLAFVLFLFSRDKVIHCLKRTSQELESLRKVAARVVATSLLQEDGKACSLFEAHSPE